ncbi:MAG: efflux RND transporter periplasmic adaptor subunit [Gemmatimonadota bacterium]
MSKSTAGRHPSISWTSMPGILLSVALTGGCSEEIRSDAMEGSGGESHPTVAVATTEADSRGTFRTHLYSERDADLYNRLMIEETAGGGIPINSIQVEVGDNVRAGQLLAMLENSDARLYVEAAAPEAEVAAAKLRRVEELRKSGAVSEAEHDQAVYESRTAEAAVKQAQLNLSRTQIRAPFAGVVSRRYVRVGDIVDDETPLFRVTAMAPLRARLLVPESDVESFGVGAQVMISGNDEATGTAQVIIVGPTIDPGSGTREVIVELADVGDFRPGTSVVVRLVDDPVDEAVDEPLDESAETAGQ